MNQGLTSFGVEPGWAPGTARREYAQMINRPVTERLPTLRRVKLGQAHAHHAMELTLRAMHN